MKLFHLFSKNNNKKPKHYLELISGGFGFASSW